MKERRLNAPRGVLMKYVTSTQVGGMWKVCIRRAARYVLRYAGCNANAYKQEPRPRGRGQEGESAGRVGEVRKAA